MVRMRLQFLCYLIASTVLALDSVVHDSQAAVTYLGPTPYLSRADGPFPVDGSNPNFYLEDFEDGRFDSPGIIVPSDPRARGVVLSTGALFTNSVDGDDGEIDGSGQMGSALMSTTFTTNLVDPPTFSSYIAVSFDIDQLGRLPTEFGFVWTYGDRDSIVRIDIQSEQPQETSFKVFANIGSGVDNDTTDDRFFGVVATFGIAAVQITSSYVGNPSFFELDHVQYGLPIPEPSAMREVVIGVFVVVGASLRHLDDRKRVV